MLLILNLYIVDGKIVFYKDWNYFLKVERNYLFSKRWYLYCEVINDKILILIFLV